MLDPISFFIGTLFCACCYGLFSLVRTNPNYDESLAFKDPVDAKLEEKYKYK